MPKTDNIEMFKKCKCPILGANLAFRLEAMTSAHRWKGKDWYNARKEAEIVLTFIPENVKILKEMRDSKCTQYSPEDFGMAIRAIEAYDSMLPSNEQDNRVSFGIDKAYDISGDEYWMSMKKMGFK